MCNRTDCAGSWAGAMACAVCRERNMSSSCVICNNSMAEVRRLRDRVEALEWIVECIDNYEWNSNRSGWFVAQGVAKEAKATMQAAREAMK